MTQNTVINYMYRDGGNNKQRGSAILKGTFNEEELAQINSALFEGDFFIPSVVGIANLQNQFSGGFDNDLDHPYHTVEEIEITDQESTVELTTQEFLAKFLAADWEAEGVRLTKSGQ